MKKTVLILGFLFAAYVALAQSNTSTTLDLEDVSDEAKSSTTLQQDDGETQLRTLEVFAGDAESTGPAQGNKETFNVEQLQQIQAADIDDLVKQSTSVTTTNSGRARGTTVRLRGLDDKRILTTLDGARLNMRMTHTSGIMIEPSFLRKVDILSSAGSASSAQGALAGSMKLETIRPSDFIKTKTGTGGFLEGKTQSANSTVSTAGSAFTKTKKHEFLAAYATREASDKNLSDTTTLQYSAFENQNALAKWSYSPRSRTVVSSSFEYLNDTSRSPLNPQDDRIIESSLVDNVFRRQLLSVSASNLSASKRINTDITTYRVVTDIDKKRVSDNRLDLRKTETLGVDFKQKFQISTDLETSNEISYGFDVFVDQASGTRNGDDLASFPDGESRQGGGFAQYKWGFQDSILMHMGMRYDSFSLSSKNNSDLNYSGQKWSRRVGLQYSFNESSAVFANWSEGINPPRFNDLFVDGLHFAVGPFENYFIPNTELKAEISNQGEYGLQYTRDGVFTDDGALSFKHTEYVWEIENYVYQSLDFEPDPSTTQFVNQDQVYLRGRETTLAYESGRFTGTSSFSQVRSWIPGLNLPMGETPADVFKVGGSYKLFGDKLTLGYEKRWISDQNRVPPEDAEVGVFAGLNTPGYELDDVFVAYKFRLFGRGDSQLNLRVNNIFNKEYRPHGSFIYGPTVDWRVSLRVLAL